MAKVVIYFSSMNEERIIQVPDYKVGRFSLPAGLQTMPLYVREGVA